MSLSVDGNDYKIEDVAEGKWFWRGDNLMWRNENDSRQPGNLTRTITLNIPVGRDRFIVFNNGPYRGFVRVAYDDNTTEYDLYSADSKSFEVAIPDSGFAAIAMMWIGRILLFFGIFILLSCFPIYVIIKHDSKTVNEWLVRNWDKCYYAALAFVYIIIMQKNSIDGSFWDDEVWQLGWIYTGDWPDGSVYSLLFTLWFKIMPYGQEHLKLLPQLFVGGAIYVAGLLGKEYKNRRFGILMSSSIAFSLTIANQCAKCIRNYSNLLFFSVLVFYLFIKKQNNHDRSIKFTIFYGFTIYLLMDSHDFGMVVGGLFLIADFILILLRKIPKRYFFEFIIPGIKTIIYVIKYMLPFSNALNGYGWNFERASVMRIYDIIRWLFSYHNLTLFMAVVGLSYIVLNVSKNIFYKSFDWNTNYTQATVTCIPIIVFFGIYLYSTFAFQGVSNLMGDRYFISVIIFLLFLMCEGIDVLVVLLSRDYSKLAQAVLIASVVVSMGFDCWVMVSPWETWPNQGRTMTQPYLRNYKASADYLMQQNDIYCNTTIFIMDAWISSTNFVDYMSVGQKYYRTHNGKREDIKSISIYKLNDDLGQYSTIYISYSLMGDRANAELNDYLDANFVVVADDPYAMVRKYVKQT